MICGSGYGGMKRFLSMSRRDTSYSYGRRKSTGHSRPTNNGRPVISRVKKNGHRRPSIGRRNSRDKMCFGHHVMAPAIYTLVCVIVVAGVIAGLSSGSNSVGLLILGVFAALLAGGIIANAVFGTHRHYRRHGSSVR